MGRLHPATDDPAAAGSLVSAPAMAASAVPDVLARLGRWKQRADDGTVRWWTLAPSPLRPGERVVATVTRVVARQVEPGADLLELWAHSRYRSGDGQVRGLAVATSERLVLVGNRNRVRVEWPWSAVEDLAVRAGPWRAELRAAGADGGPIILLRPPVRASLEATEPEDAYRLLTLEGAFHCARGQGDAWAAALASRFEA